MFNAKHQHYRDTLKSKAPLLLLLLAAFGLFASMFVGQSFAAVEIVAKVNGKAITNFQVDQRAAFLRMVTNLEDTEANRLQVRNDARQMLIDEVLKLEAAKSIDPTIQERSRATARNLVDQNFAFNGKTGGTVLRENGINAETVQRKFIVDIVWGEFIKFKFSDKLDNVENIVDTTLQRMQKSALQPQIKLSEIILLPEPNRSVEATLALANEIVKAVNRGADFNAIAQQYSAAGTARKGGQLGWVMQDQLPSEIQEALNVTKTGSISAPIQRDGIIILMRKEGTRNNGVADAGQDIISMARVILPLAKDATNADRLEAAARLERDSVKLKNCDNVIALNKVYKSGILGFVKEITLATFTPQMRSKIEQLKIFEPSEPLAFAEGISVLMVCSRVKPRIELPSRDEVMQVEFSKVFGTLSERYLLRLRRSATIEAS